MPDPIPFPRKPTPTHAAPLRTPRRGMGRAGALRLEATIRGDEPDKLFLTATCSRTGKVIDLCATENGPGAEAGLEFVAAAVHRAVALADAADTPCPVA